MDPQLQALTALVKEIGLWGSFMFLVFYYVLLPVGKKYVELLETIRTTTVSQADSLRSLVQDRHSIQDSIQASGTSINQGLERQTASLSDKFDTLRAATACKYNERPH